MGKKVLLGMSGGVDSSVSALLLLKQGYDVTGATMNLGAPNVNFEKDVTDAKKVSEKLGINHIVLDFSEIFKNEVIDYFGNEYIKGRTPNPCVVCNKKLKFGLFLKYALKNGFDFIATGHYANIEYDEKTNKYFLKKSKTKKDQSYFLYNLNQKIMAHTLFPIGELEKSVVREIAKENDLPVALKSDSQDICFIKNISHQDFMMDTLKIESPEGDFLDENGNIIGKHRGIINYTVGQRKKLGASFGTHMYVAKIDSKNNTVILHRDKPAEINSLIAVNLSFTMGESLGKPFKTLAKTRYSVASPVECTVFSLGNNTAKIVFDSLQKLVSPGQSVVFYDEDVVLGGGIIDEVIN